MYVNRSCGRINAKNNHFKSFDSMCVAVFFSRARSVLFSANRCRCSYYLRSTPITIRNPNIVNTSEKNLFSNSERYFIWMSVETVERYRETQIDR